MITLNHFKAWHRTYTDTIISLSPSNSLSFETRLSRNRKKKQTASKIKKSQIKPIVRNTSMPPATKFFSKVKIPKALREQVWLKHMGKKFEGKCTVTWCSNTISVFDWEAGHNIPESKGGPTTLSNLQPLCSRCNKSMADKYTIDEWNELGSSKKKRCWCCLMM